MPPPSRRRILLFGKLPEPGRVKTRLVPLLGERGAAELYAAFLEDVARTVRAVPEARGELWLSPPVAGSDPPARARRTAARLAERLELKLRWQAGVGLGERLRNAFERAFVEGAAAAVAVGSDHPTLRPSRLADAVSALDTVDVSLGPSRDGGYYLIGLRRSAWPAAAELFRGIPWSSARVLARTRKIIRRLDLPVHELPEWYDVDEPEDLRRMRADLDRRSRTAAALGRILPAEEARPGSTGAASRGPRA